MFKLISAFVFAVLLTACSAKSDEAKSIRCYHVQPKPPCLDDSSN
jgi:hypothetical protein